MSDDRIDVIVLGVKIGSASGWDPIGEFFQEFYDFEAIDGSFPKGTLSLSYIDSKSEILSEILNDDGDVVNSIVTEFSVLDYVNKLKGKI